MRIRKNTGGKLILRHTIWIGEQNYYPNTTALYGTKQRAIRNELQEARHPRKQG
jgi:hypothetical protein